MQSALFQVAAIAEPDNIFINFAGFVPLEILKGLLGYRPYETAKINIRLNHIGTPEETVDRITSYNVCYTKLLRYPPFG